MGFFDFVRYNLAWIASFALLWPINVPLAALAYKIGMGYGPARMSRNELWWRSALAALCVALATAAAIILDYGLAVLAEIPAGFVHLVVFALLCAAGWWLCTFAFSLDDPLQGLGMFFLYLYIPLAVLWTANRLLPFWTPLVNLYLAWLAPAA